jgi:hypothetical protein
MKCDMNTEIAEIGIVLIYLHALNLYHNLIMDIGVDFKSVFNKSFS